MATVAQQAAVVDTYSTSSITLGLYTYTATGTAQASVVVIGS